MKVYLLEDPGRGRFEPFALTRPVGEILFGCETLGARLARVLGASTEYAAPAHLLGFAEPGSAAVATVDAMEAPCLILASRFVAEGAVGELDRTTALLTSGGRLVGWYVEAMDDLPEGWQEVGIPYPPEGTPTGDLPSAHISGRLLDSIWQLMTENAEQITSDLEGDAPASEAASGPGTVYGSHSVQVAADVVVGPHVVFDARTGPIRIESGAVIEPFTVVGGPCYIGAGSTLLGGVVRGSSIGPCCRIRGEVATTVVIGYSNKAHDGYLGHAVIGRWVNLGAMTTNSDLKNNYSPVRVDLGDGPVDTGERKVGVFLGDHVKTGIGTLLGTGTVVGAGSTILANPPPPRFTPAFAWSSGSPGTSDGSGSSRGRADSGRPEELADSDPTFVRYDLERFIATTKIIMGRRDQTLSDGMEALLRRAWHSHDGDHA